MVPKYQGVFSLSNNKSMTIDIYVGYLVITFLQGINGILADEMGLGKTVQSIALLAHLAEVGGFFASD